MLSQNTALKWTSIKLGNIVAETMFVEVSVSQFSRAGNIKAGVNMNLSEILGSLKRD